MSNYESGCKPNSCSTSRAKEANYYFDLVMVVLVLLKGDGLILLSRKSELDQSVSFTARFYDALEPCIVEFIGQMDF
ncbi:MAG: hypothetical protein RIC35_00335 [Marinoscillum sp.]